MGKSWEAICRRCGQCCYEKYRTRQGVAVQYSSPCEFLDTATKLCRVYANRFRLCSQCRKMTIFHALFSAYLPDSCGYVQRFRIWRRSAKNRTRG